MSDRTYIGNGRQKTGSARIELTLRMEDVLSAETFTYNGKTYLKCVVVPRREYNAFDYTHTVFVEAKDRSYNEKLIDEQEARE